MHFLEAKDIHKKYHKHVALNGVSVQVKPQTVFGLLGPNGAGKTSLIRIINQITAPDQGQVLINGEPLSPKHTSLIGYLPEERGLYKKMMVGEHAVYLAQLKGIPKKQAIEELRFWFEKFDINHWWNRRIEELSKGMQQKVQFITTVIHKPQFLIFDEPFSGFDPVNAELLKNEILDLRKNGATILLSTHNMASVEELCDDIALINKSNVVLSGSVSEIRNSYKNNLFEVSLLMSEASGQISNNELFSVIAIEQKGNFAFLKIKLNQSDRNNDLLAELMKMGSIISFKEILPSMNEIFIQRVSATT